MRRRENELSKFGRSGCQGIFSPQNLGRFQGRRAAALELLHPSSVVSVFGERKMSVYGKVVTHGTNTAATGPMNNVPLLLLLFQNFPQFCIFFNCLQIFTLEN